MYGVATFYHFFTLKPKGKHTFVLCTGTACYVKGAGKIQQAVEAVAARCKFGQTTADDKISLVSARCVGSCGLAPVAVLDNQVAGKLTPDSAVERVKAWQTTTRGGGRMTVEELQELAEQERERQRTIQAPHPVLLRRRMRLLRQHDRPRHAQEGAQGKGPRTNEVEVIGTGCMGLCGEGPAGEGLPDGTLYQHVDAERRPPDRRRASRAGDEGAGKPGRHRRTRSSPPS